MGYVWQLKGREGRNLCNWLIWFMGSCMFLRRKQPKPLSNVNSHICQICGDDVGVTPEGELFVACNECAFPVCRPCYDYERKDGNQSCPQCHTRYKRHKGWLAEFLDICATSVAWMSICDIILSASNWRLICFVGSKTSQSFCCVGC